LRLIKGKYAPFNGLGHSVLQAVWGVLAIDFNRISVASQVFLQACCGSFFSYKNLTGEQYAFT